MGVVRSVGTRAITGTTVAPMTWSQSGSARPCGSTHLAGRSGHESQASRLWSRRDRRSVGCPPSHPERTAAWLPLVGLGADPEAQGSVVTAGHRSPCLSLPLLACPGCAVQARAPGRRRPLQARTRGAFLSDRGVWVASDGSQG